MLGFIIGPLFQLQLFGTICPCLESSENKNARQAVQSINSHCQRILWHPNNSTQKKGGGGFSLGNWFGGGNKDDDDGALSSSSDQQQTSTISSSSSEPCLARLTVRDNNADSHQLLPEISVDLLLQRPETSPAMGGNNNSIGRRKIRIKLCRVDKVRLEDNQIVLTGKPGGSGGSAKELLRFTALQHSNNNEDDNGNNNNPIDDSRVVEMLPPITSDARNMLVHHWMVLVEWERQRRDKNNNGDEYDDDDDDDEHGRPNFIQKRAQQAAHFARREIEMKKMKKEREQRKAKLIAETGGLKYTALAMATAKNNNNNSIT